MIAAVPHLSIPRLHFLGHRIAVPGFSSPPSHLSSPPSPLSLRSPTIAAAASAAAIPSTVPSTPTSLYKVLGLAEGATSCEIKAAYRRLARVCHPDAAVAAGRAAAPAADEFMQIHAAYSTLSDPVKRSEYDRELIDLRLRGRSSPRSHRFSGQQPRRTWETDQCW